MTFNQKELSIIKLDVIKNQELLTEVIDRSRLQVIENSFDRSKIDMPLLNMDQFNAIEENDEQKQLLAHTIRRLRKSFDAKRTTYQIMKMVIDNRLAEGLNMGGKRGGKRAFGRLAICTLIIDAVKDFFPNESILVIKTYMSDWLKQAPKRK
ncbi:unnamed protein product [Macrosiphum euphorbiae]|uniref:DUF4806 domain-containing protein n=1 Tax=Macrosiphum euphorbiae TaxID=13131 RepID=A0AAV0XIJ4_9HEMI|nr:unnamed protein product [Macrosiphum euphorbiae]